MRSTLRSIMALVGRGLPRSASWSTARRLGIIYIVAEFFLTPGLGLVQSHAQSASCPIGAPVTITASSLALTNNNECQGLVFTSPTTVMLNLPAANTVAPGFQAMLMSMGGGGILIIPPASTNLNGGISSMALGQGQSGMLYGDGTNYFLSVGGGAAGTAPNASVAGTALGTLPGTNLSNSPTVNLSNGILTLNNPASIVPSADVMRLCGFNRPIVGQPPSSISAMPSWLLVLDYLGTMRRIPMCG